MRFWQPLSVAFFYLGAGNTILARFAGTCTQGDADRLYGVVLSITLYGIALLGLWLSSNTRTIVLVSLPVLPIIIWQLWFSFRLSFEILAQGRSACSVLEGAAPPYPNSGSELFFAMSWPLMSLGVLLGIFFVLRARYARAQSLR
jgi:hypothetical protein